MTIAACYLSPEGVVFGADSTTTFLGNGGQSHYYNHAQKLFEVGEDSSLGIVTWGLGGLVVSSYRMLVAEFSDDLTTAPPTTAIEVAQRWIAHFGAAYSGSTVLQPPIAQAVALHGKTARTAAEEAQLQELLDNLTVGFCIGGYLPNSRKPFAYRMNFSPIALTPTPEALSMPDHRFWGVPNFFKRLVNGCDDDLKSAIATSGKWSGTPTELDALVDQYKLKHPIIPIRDAIDFTHSCIYSTIKAMKFSNLPQVCGGPIEIAVVTADRKFRWVKHKSLNAAIRDGDTYDDC